MVTKREMPDWRDLGAARLPVGWIAAGLVTTYGFSLILAPGEMPGAALLGTLAAMPFLLYLSIQDLASFRIPDWSTAAFGGLGVVLLIAVAPGLLLVHLGTGAVVWIALYASSEWMYRRTGRDALGLGDVKLLAAIAIWVGPIGLPSVIVVAATLGVTACLLTRKDAVAFGPFLAFGFWITWLYGPLI